jgi:hypothetical protein
MRASATDILGRSLMVVIEVGSRLKRAIRASVPSRARLTSRLSVAVCSAGALLLAACQGETGAERDGEVQGPEEGWTHASPDGLPSVSAESYLEAGRYLAVVALCNDCHTEGWLPDGTVPEHEWLAGSATGLQGTWGVTFPSNLRLRAQEWSEPGPAPTGFAAFGADTITRKLIDPEHQVRHWSEFDAGGHFPAMEVPDLLVEDLRTFFRDLRPSDSQTIRGA